MSNVNAGLLTEPDQGEINARFLRELQDIRNILQSRGNPQQPSDLPESNYLHKDAYGADIPDANSFRTNIGAIGEAPIDGTPYARSDAGWSSISGSSSSGIIDVTSAFKPYAAGTYSTIGSEYYNIADVPSSGLFVHIVYASHGWNSTLDPGGIAGTATGSFTIKIPVSSASYNWVGALACSRVVVYPAIPYAGAGGGVDGNFGGTNALGSYAELSHYPYYVRVKASLSGAGYRIEIEMTKQSDTAGPGAGQCSFFSNVAAN